MCAIPEGTTRAYGEIARMIGRPDAPRAVGAAVGALRIANSVGGVLSTHRVLGDASSGPLLTGALALAALAVITILWPAWIGWPFGVLAGWLAFNLGIRGWRLRQRRQRELRDDD